MYKDLQGAVERLFPASQPPLDPLQHARVQHLRFAKTAGRALQGRDALVDDLTTRLLEGNKEGDKAAVVLAGNPGMGKTAVVAGVLKNLESHIREG